MQSVSHNEKLLLYYSSGFSTPRDTCKRKLLVRALDRAGVSWSFIHHASQQQKGKESRSDKCGLFFVWLRVVCKFWWFGCSFSKTKKTFWICSSSSTFMLVVVVVVVVVVDMLWSRLRSRSNRSPLSFVKNKPKRLIGEHSNIFSRIYVFIATHPTIIVTANNKQQITNNQ